MFVRATSRKDSLIIYHWAAETRQLNAKLEPTAGFEPATSCLGTKCKRTLPLAISYGVIDGVFSLHDPRVPLIFSIVGLITRGEPTCSVKCRRLGFCALSESELERTSSDYSYE